MILNTRAERVADVLRDAHDYMLVHGRCRGKVVNRAGEVCLVGAIGRAGLSHNPTDVQSAMATMVLLGFGTFFNDDPDTTDDMVFDSFAVTEKRLRDGEIEPPSMAQVVT